MILARALSASPSHFPPSRELKHERAALHCPHWRTLMRLLVGVSVCVWPRGGPTSSLPPPVLLVNHRVPRWSFLRKTEAPGAKTNRWECERKAGAAGNSRGRMLSLRLKVILFTSSWQAERERERERERRECKAVWKEEVEGREGASEGGWDCKKREREREGGQRKIGGEEEKTTMWASNCTRTHSACSTHTKTRTENHTHLLCTARSLRTHRFQNRHQNVYKFWHSVCVPLQPVRCWMRFAAQSPQSLFAFWTRWARV